MRTTKIDLHFVQLFFEHFSSELLDDYTKLVEGDNYTFNQKEINDPLWGTITLSPFEVAILDSPLVQRLRSIKQLGIVHYVYPGAIHTRFEHTLGVLAQTQNLINALNSFPTRSNGQVEINRSISQTLRAAALLHDIGHPCFSHVSEKALANFFDYQEPIASFNRTLDIDKSQLSEIAAYYIIRSKSFRSFIDVLFDRMTGWPQLHQNSARNKEEVIDAISRIIISKKFSDEYPTAQDLISGPFDADKIDYLMRDALYCGIPNVVDTSRLVQKLELRNVPEREVPKHLSRGLKAGLTGYKLFGIKVSGSRVLDELIMARTFLYSKVYRHQKVQAVESMIEAFYRACAKQVGVEELLSIAYRMADDEVLFISSENFRDRMREKNIRFIDTPQSKQVLPVIGELTRRIRTRRLFARVMQLDSSYPSDSRSDKDEQRRNLIRLTNDLKNVQKLGLIKDKLISEIENLIKIAPKLVRGQVSLLTDYAVSITPPSGTSGNSEVDRALVFHKNGDISRFGEALFNSDAWSSAYDYSGAASGFIFSDMPLALVTYIAAEKTLYDLYGVVIPQSSLAGSKVTAEEIAEAKKLLSKLGYYQALPIEMRPVPAILEEVSSKRTIDAFCDRVASYQGPTEIYGDHVIDGPLKTKVENWLKQFVRDDFVELALHLLDKFKIIKRSEVVYAAKKFFNDNPEFQGAYICGFGSLKDSAAIVSYFANDLPEGVHSGVYTVEEAKKKAEHEEKNHPVVFFDDLIASGGQACDLLSGWFQDDENRRDLGEERLPLHQDTVEFLRGRKTAFLFVAGWKAGIAELEKRCKSLGLNSTVYSHLSDEDIPFAFENCMLDFDPALVEEFRAHCNRIGEEILSAKGQSQDKVSKRGLGYGNRAMLLALPYNVPTQTLTCMRERCEKTDLNWQEIFLRRTKR